MDASTVDQFVQVLRRGVPDLKIAFKDESRVQKILGVLLYPFNPEYLAHYTTTIGDTIYFSSKQVYEKSPSGSLTVIAHEFVHILDSKKDLLFRVKYLFPQILVVVPLIAYGILAGLHAWILAIPVVGYVLGAYLSQKSKAAFVVTMVVSLLAMCLLGWFLTKWKLLVLLGLVVLGPWPAPWRSKYELRGYAMSLAVEQWLTGVVPDKDLSFYVDQFTGPAYLYMNRDGSYIKRTLEASRQQAQIGALQMVSPYDVVFDFLYARHLVN
jgi:sorbitol-specific phosphotransferase system component IIC